MNRSSKQKINTETWTLNDTLDQMKLKDIYKTFYSKVTEYTFFSSVHKTFSSMDYKLSHTQKKINKLKTEIIPSIFSDHCDNETRNQLQE